jgi:uncharacterized protein
MKSSSENSRRFAVAAVLFESGLVVLAVVLGWLLQRNPLPGVGTGPDRWSDAIAVACGALAALPMLLGLMLVEWYPVGPLRELQRTVETQLVPLVRHWTIPQMALVSLAAGFGEEMLFRGLLQSALADRLDGPAGLLLAVLAASAVFGICHWVTTSYAVLAGAVGIYLGLLLVIFDNLLVPIVAHALYDLIALIYLSGKFGDGTVDDAEGGEPASDA